MEDKNISQISLVDGDSRLMKNNGRFDVCYNVQAAVDVESHMTVAFEASSNPGDIGSLGPIAKEIQEKYEIEGVVTNTTDKGYNKEKDMVESLLEGVIPYVTPTKEENIREVETDYEELKEGKEEYTIREQIKAGIVPKGYEEKIKVRIEERKEKEDVEETQEETRKASEIREKAIETGTFQRDIRTNEVYCPMGEILNKKSTKEDGTQRFCNKRACKLCKNPCCKQDYKEIDMKKGQKELIPANSEYKKEEKKIEKKTKKKKKLLKKKKVVIEIILDEELLKKRKQTSEHSQGTMKTANNMSYFNMRGKAGVESELAIYFMASNTRNVINGIGMPKLLQM